VRVFVDPRDTKCPAVTLTGRETLFLAGTNHFPLCRQGRDATRPQGFAACEVRSRSAFLATITVESSVYADSRGGRRAENILST
jgi:hypothetical protein